MPVASSDPPESRPGRPFAFYSVLLRMGFTCAPTVTSRAVVSYTAFPPLPGCPGGLFLLHYPWSHLHRTLSGILPYEARTFLTCSLSAFAAANICPTYSYFLYHILLYLSKNIPFYYYAWNRLPPTNSLTIEFFGKSSLLTPRKYSRNFKRRFAS